MSGGTGWGRVTIRDYNSDWRSLAEAPFRREGCTAPISPRVFFSPVTLSALERRFFVPESHGGFLSLLREEYPQADRLAYERILAGRTTFFDTSTNRPLPGFTEPLILAALILANHKALKVGAMLKLSYKEKQLWNRHFENLSINSFCIELRSKAVRKSSTSKK